MGYPELLRALEAEANRQARAIAEAAAADARRVLEDARCANEKAAAEARALAVRDAERARRRADALLRIREEHALIVEARNLLAELRGAVTSRLPALPHVAAVLRLVDELLPHLDGPEWELRVPPSAVTAARDRADGRARVVAAEVDGAIAVRGPIALDNTLRSRLERALARLEPEIVTILFGAER